ncbi:MAG: Ig-like domain-containing protein [Patescibacteria group bacterium]|nr:MAG: Ig-like domain-containing protein [Patescibacteria group bacterium]
MKTPFKTLIISFTLLASCLAIILFGATEPLMAQETEFGITQNQGVDTGLEFAEGIGLSKTDPRIMAARIIQIALGFLGILAVGLIIYAGFIWMTSKGDEEKVSKAKTILKNGAIGLVIVLGSFAIATFVLGRLQQSLGGGSGDPGSGDPGTGGTTVFAVQSTTPANNMQNVPRNAIIRFSFTKNLQESSVNANSFIVSYVNQTGGNSVIDGAISIVNGRYVEFTPSATCDEPNQNINCFEAGRQVSVEAAGSLGGILSINNETLFCSGSYNCSILFTVGNWLDTEAPRVNILNRQICAAAENIIEASSIDNYGVSHIDFYVNEEFLDRRQNDSNPFVGSPFNTSAIWNSTGYEVGQVVGLKVTAYDLDNNTGTAEEFISLSPSHCCNGIQDGDETGIDCGGSCLACTGQACAVDNQIPEQCSDDLCSSGLCSTLGSSSEICDDAGYGGDISSCCLCQGRPKIEWISPMGGFCSNDVNQYCRDDQVCGSDGHCERGVPNGAPGNFVTIGGQGFGAQKGKVFFTDNNGNLVEAALADDPGLGNAQCTGQAWRDEQIIAVVPSSVGNGGITVELANGQVRDASNDAFGPLVNDFVRNNIERPGVCLISPDSGVFNQNVQYQGVKLNASEAYFGNLYQNIKSPLSSFSDKSGTASVPNLQDGQTTTFVEKVGVESNFLGFVKDPEPYTGPIISSIEPSSGPIGQYVTVRGSGFGHIRGTSNLYFGPTDGILADYNFPEICADSVWSDNQIIVKVPSGVSLGEFYKLTLSASGYPPVDSGTLRFQVMEGTPDPGICRVSPIIGQPNQFINIYGEYFRDKDENSAARFYNQQNQSGNALAEWAIDQSASGIKPWKVLTSVPQNSQTGPLRILAGSPMQLSNSVNFAVGSCQQNADCGGSQVCCLAGLPEGGKCKDNEMQCYGNILTSVYEWRFNTGSEFACAADQEQCGTVCCATGSCERDPETGEPQNKCEGCLEDQNKCGNGQCCNGACNPGNNGQPSYCDDPPSCSGYNLLQCMENYFCPNSPGNCSPVQASGQVIVTGQCGNQACADLPGCELGGCVYNNSLNKCVKSGSGVYDCSRRAMLDTQQNTILLNNQPAMGTCETFQGTPRWHINWNGTSCPQGWGGVTSGNNRCVENLTNINGPCSLCSSPGSCLSVGNNGVCAVGDNICDADSECNANTNQCEKLDAGSCECCCDKNKNTPEGNPGCCYGLSCGYSCGQGQTNNADFGFCSGCAPNGVPNDALCNCENSSGKFCAYDPVKYPTGACMDCSSITDPYECSQRPGCCVDAMDNNRCTGLGDRDYIIEEGEPGGQLRGGNSLYQGRDEGARESIIIERGEGQVGERGDGEVGSGSLKFCGYYNCTNQYPENSCSPLVFKEGSYITRQICESSCPAAQIPCSADMNTCSNPSCPSGMKCDGSSCNCVPDTTGPGNPCRDGETGACTITCSLGHQCMVKNPYSGGDIGSTGDDDTCRCCCKPPTADDPTDSCHNLHPSLSCLADQGSCSGGERGLCCGCTSDGQCGDVATTGCGTRGNRCCQARPRVEVDSHSPAPESLDVCRNTAITVIFDQEMDISSFSNDKIVVFGDYGRDVCPLGMAPVMPTGGQASQPVSWWRKIASTLLPSFDFARANNTNSSYCYVQGNVTGVKISMGRTRANFNLTKALDPNRDYYVAVRGDADLAQVTPGNNKPYYNNGITNIAGVGMIGRSWLRGGGNIVKFNNVDFSNAEVWKFRTGSDVCRLNSVRIDPSFRLFNRINQSENFIAEARSSNGSLIQSIPGVYSWSWTWSSANNEVASVTQSPSALDTALVKPGNRRDAQTVVRATSEITFDDIGGSGTNSTVGQTRTGTAQIRVFLCENPWPPYSIWLLGSWPWSDQRTGIEFYYCRDAGGFGTQDDLPALDENPVTRDPDNKICMIGSNAGQSCNNDGDCGGNILGSCLPALLREYFFFRAPMPAGAPVLDKENSIINPLGREVTLNWSAVSDAVKYKVYYGLASRSYNRSFETESTSETISGLSNGARYYFAVTALTAQNQETDFSNEISLIPRDITPPPVPQIQASAGNEAISLFWEPASDARKYIAYIGISSNNYLHNMVTTYPFSSTGTPKVVFPLLNNNTDYYLAVRSVDMYGNVSDYSNQVTWRPNRPNLISATPGGSSITLRWLPFVGAQGYTVYVSGGQSEPLEINASGTQLTVSNLVDGTNYNFSIRARFGQNQLSEPSNSLNATPGGIRP